MFLIDSNILVAEILTKYEQDELTEQYRRFYRQIPLIKRVVTDFVLNEFELYMVQVVPSRYQKKMTEEEKRETRLATVAYMQRVTESFSLDSPSKATIKNAFILYQRFTQEGHYISFTDSLLLAMAQANGYTLVTKDKRLRMLAHNLDVDSYRI